MGAVALIADIEKAFLQIYLSEEDRDSHRFLWYETPIKNDLNSTSELPPLKTYRMKRVTFGVTTSPFLLAATLRKHLLEQPEHEKKVANMLIKSFYIDDLVLAVSSTEEANHIYDRSRTILASANMNLRKWCSNDPGVMQHLAEDGQDLTGNKIKKVLGVIWHTVTDELAVDVSRVLSDNCVDQTTKRNVLHTTAKIFDPFGILGPFTIRAKILMQNIWKLKLDWDIFLPENIKLEWQKWCSELTTFSDYAIPRCLVKHKPNEIELHIFADASPHAYGAVAYLKCLDTSAINFIISKNRVSPLNQKSEKSLTLPKLELTAALCATRMQTYILENLSLNVKNITLWSDSKIALYWIRGKSMKWKPYVKNRVNEIQRLSQGVWRYIPGAENPADMLTRGVPAKLLVESSLWMHGPSWLSENSQYWPIDEFHEFKETSKVISYFVGIEENPTIAPEPLFPLDKYSNLDKMFRVTAYIKRFLNNTYFTKEKLVETVNEINAAEIYWVKFVQRNEFAEEITSLIKKKPINKNSAILTLTPFLDEKQILRLGGRLEEAPLAYETRHPAILPKKSLFTDKVVWKAHEATRHSGINATLAITREKFWIIQGRQRIKSLIGKCVKCKRFKGNHGNEPFAPLPRDRITIANPFKVTGLDFAGPLYVSTNKETKSKTYIMLLTCTVTRAVHLELVPDLTSESCIRALRRFIARRGVPNVIYSDNAKTFKRASLELKELCNILARQEIQDLAQNQRIQWRFIVERAAWWGGFWERLVRTVKQALKLTLGRASINYDELQTILAEVEATVNSRPLTYIDDDPTNLLILSPSNFLIGSNDIGFSINTIPEKIERNEILQQWKGRERLLKKFWHRWSSDYLQQLRSAHHINSIKSNPFKVGDVVLLHDQNLPRLLWKMVKITSVYQGRDGRIRACEVQTSTANKLRRPIQLLYPLEVNNFSPGEDEENV